MQYLGLNLSKILKDYKMTKLDDELLEGFANFKAGDKVACPFCLYEAVKIFQDEEGKSMKCFACGIWRRIN